MRDDTLARQLHDRVTRGESLSETEVSFLDEWYAREDEEEDGLFAAPAPRDFGKLQTQINATIAELATVVLRIQTLTAENEALRHDVAALYRQLTKNSTVQPV